MSVEAVKSVRFADLNTLHPTGAGVGNCTTPAPGEEYHGCLLLEWHLGIPRPLLYLDHISGFKRRIGRLTNDAGVILEVVVLNHFTEGSLVGVPNNPHSMQKPVQMYLADKLLQNARLAEMQLAATIRWLAWSVWPW